MTLCDNCKTKLPSLDKRLRQVNSDLHQLGLEYYKVLPVHAVDSILTSHGFNATSTPLVALGEDFKLHEEVGEGRWLALHAHRMESGNWEVVAYVN